MTKLEQIAQTPVLGIRLALLSLAWAAAMMASAAINLCLLDRTLEKNTLMLVLFFGLGALVAFPLTMLVLRFAPTDWRFGQRYACAFLALGMLTIGFTSLIFALQFRIYFAQWHDDTYSRRFLFETVFTVLSAVYQFLVLGLRLYLPLGLIALLGASWAFATKRI